MKIVLLSMNFAPELTGIGKYSGELADALVARGHEVVVVCAPPFYPSWRVAAGHANRYRLERPRPGLAVWRCPVWLPRRLSGLTRLLHLASFALTSAPVLLGLVAWRADVHFVVAPALFSAPMGWLSARLAGAKAWLHIQDFEMDAAFELGMLKGRWLRGFMQAAERRLLLGFDVASTISRRMLLRLALKGVPLDRTEMLPNGVAARRRPAVEDAAALRAALGIEADRLVCLFSGTINRKQGLGVLIETARLLAGEPRIEFVICGEGELRPALEAEARNAGLSNLRFLDLQPAETLPALLAMADIHLLPQLRGAADLVMPSKLGGMLASGRPVVAAANRGTEVASVVEGRGIVVEPEVASGFAAAIRELARDEALRQRLGAAGRDYAQDKLDTEALYDRLELQLARLHRPRGALESSGDPRAS